MIPSPDLEIFPLPPIASPQPRRPSSRPVSQPIERAISYAQEHALSPIIPGPGPTFLSAASTPSPPGSPTSKLRSGYPNPLRSNPVTRRQSATAAANPVPVSPPSTNTSPYGSIGSSYGKQALPPLTPLPLSPLTLKPCSKPPVSLNAPNPTTRANFSPTAPPQDFPADYPIAGYSYRFGMTSQRPVSHSASASVDVAGPSKERAPEMKQRSPSQPYIPTYFASGTYPPGGPPVIPLRMSSIPTNNKPRKLSLLNQRSLTHLKSPGSDFEAKEDMIIPAVPSRSSTLRRLSPPSRGKKSLPTPPTDVDEEQHNKRGEIKSDPQPTWSMFPPSSKEESSSRRISDPERRGVQAWRYDDIIQPAIAEIPTKASTSARRAQSHSRLYQNSLEISLHDLHEGLGIEHPPPLPEAAPKSSSFPPAFPTSDTNLDSPINLPIQIASPLVDYAPPTAAARERTKSISPTSKADTPLHAHEVEQRESRWKRTGKAVDRGLRSETNKLQLQQQQQVSDGRPVQMSRTQMDKDRKKRSKAKIIIEHVDVIKDDFWEKRPWILSGKTG